MSKIRNRVLIVDDEIFFLEAIDSLLPRELGSFVWLWLTTSELSML